jgi:hypothetical protein
MRFVLLVAIAVAALAADAQRIVYTKSFPGSNPAYVSIALERSGAVAYKEAVDDDPDKLQLESEATTAIFDLAEKLDRFAKPLESGLKVANIGAKTYRWEDGAESHEVKYNYSQDDNARTLQDWFDRITDSQRCYLELKRVIRHDKLGVNDAVIRIQENWDKKRLTGARQFLPLLDQVSKNEIYVNIARERAARIADAIRASRPQTP